MKTKLLMLGGVSAVHQNDDVSAQYWSALGLQGSLLVYVVADWDHDAGASSAVPFWGQMRTFQSRYADYGVGENFIKIATYSSFDWTNADHTALVLTHFSHAAALAKYAGMRGIALDLEPYKGIWSATGVSDAQAQDLGVQIGQAMHNAFPTMGLMVLPDLLYETAHWGARYALALPFLRGLLSLPWTRVILGAEQTYSQSPASIVHTMTTTIPPEYQFSRTKVQMAPGIWPLGPTSTDKAARMTVSQFQQNLSAMYGLQPTPPYVWIFCDGSAWQTDGPYGAGPVVANFNDYIGVIHRVQDKYSG